MGSIDHICKVYIAMIHIWFSNSVYQNEFFKSYKRLISGDFVPALQ